MYMQRYIKYHRYTPFQGANRPKGRKIRTTKDSSAHRNERHSKRYNRTKSAVSIFFCPRSQPSCTTIYHDKDRNTIDKTVA